MIKGGEKGREEGKERRREKEKEESKGKGKQGRGSFPSQFQLSSLLSSTSMP